MEQQRGGDESSIPSEWTEEGENSDEDWRVEESVFDGGENYNRKRDQEEEEGKSTTVSPEVPPNGVEKETSCEEDKIDHVKLPKEDCAIPKAPLTKETVIMLETDLMMKNSIYGPEDSVQENNRPKPIISNSEEEFRDTEEGIHLDEEGIHFDPRPLKVELQASGLYAALTFTLKFDFRLSKSNSKPLAYGISTLRSPLELQISGLKQLI
ncbi:hypothetical protein L6452_27564 [Arctium lappa]|uniref:Uncharacterized protein n=1 Tax=Arctium lappa TaxID=4217 RepID=A0ACB8ZWQ7_ARCLA|nr:hypothetical protein L6452_27564 [Arctium lappa]